MTELHELVEFVNLYGKSQYPTTDELETGDTQLSEFYRAVKDKALTSNDEAADFLGLDVKSSHFRNLKSGLFRRLVNAVFHIDFRTPDYSDYQRAYYNCWRDWAAAKILLGRGKRQVAVKLSKQILTSSLKFEFSDLNVAITASLRLYYGSVVGDRKLFERYNGLYHKWQRVWAAENLAQEKYSEVVADYLKKRQGDERIHQAAIEAIGQLAPDAEHFQTTRLCTFLSMLKVTKHLSVNDYAGTIEVCEEGLTLLRQKPFPTNSPQQTLLLQALVCHIQLRQFNEGYQITQDLDQLLLAGSVNWYRSLELKYMLAMHTGKYEAAMEAVGDAVSHKSFKKKTAIFQEKWFINQAYLKYLESIDVLFIDGQYDRLFQRFRLARFLNEVPTFSQDKKGLNIPILILHVLFLIQQENYDKAADRIYALEKYAGRYIRKDDNYRTNCFIKMLSKINDAGFHKNRSLQLATKYIDMLEAMPIEKANQAYEIEIIPYEELWEHIIHSLENKRQIKESAMKRRYQNTPAAKKFFT